MTAPRDRRHINRIDSTKSNDFYASVFTASEVFGYKISDYNSLSVRLSPEEPRRIKPNDVIEKVEIFYGEKVISTIENPVFVRQDAQERLILKISDQTTVRGIRKKERLAVKDNFKPMIIAKDPVKIDTILHFDVININATGLGLRTSLSNKHLFSSQEITEANLILPAIGSFSVPFSIKQIKMQGNFLYVGIGFLNVDRGLIDSLAKFAIFGTLPPTSHNLESKLKAIRANISKIYEIGNGARIEIANNVDDYIGALKIRYEAYQKAGKMDSSINSFEDMSDSFDKHSILLVAKADGAVIGTVRMVYCASEKLRFPFEKILADNLFLKEASKREDYYEVSRLAIHPAFQKSDVLVKLFKEVARLTILNQKTTLCFSTRILRPLYLKIGFEKISDEVPHPVLANEFLALMKVDSRAFVEGASMTHDTWKIFSRDVVHNLESHGIIESNSSKNEFFPNIESFMNKK